jgi:hypothetical protein
MKNVLWFLTLTLLILFGKLGYGQGCANASNIYTFTFNGKTYEIIKEKKTWTNAAACAVERGGYLVHIGDVNEQNALFDAILNGAGIPNNYVVVPDGGGVAYVWIGATDKVQEGTWLWDGNNDGVGTNFWNGEGAAGAGNGSPVGDSYINWGGTSTGVPKEPDNFNGNQDVAAMALMGWPSGSGALGIAGEWNDINIENSIYYIVEFDNAGLNEYENGFIRFSPNPVRDYLIISAVNARDRFSEIKIQSGDGKIVSHDRVIPSSQFKLQLSGLKDGLYLVSLKMNDQTWYHHKIIVE